MHLSHRRLTTPEPPVTATLALLPTGLFGQVSAVQRPRLPLASEVSFPRQPNQFQFSYFTFAIDQRDCRPGSAPRQGCPVTYAHDRPVSHALQALYVSIVCSVAHAWHAICCAHTLLCGIPPFTRGSPGHRRLHSNIFRSIP